MSPCKGYLRVTRATFVDRAVDGMLPSPGDLRNIRDETFPVSRDESDDKANLRDRLSIQPPTDEEHPGNRECPDDLRTLWIEYDAHGDRHKATRIGLLIMVGLPCCTWSNISKSTVVTV